MKWLMEFVRRSAESEEQRRQVTEERQQFYEERQRLDRIAAEQEAEVLRLKEMILRRR